MNKELTFHNRIYSDETVNKASIHVILNIRKIVTHAGKRKIFFLKNIAKAPIFLLWVKFAALSLSVEGGI